EAGTALDKEIETQEQDAGLLAHHHFARAEIFALQFRPLQALPHYERAYEPDVAMTLNNLGNLYAATQKHAQAETALREALDSYRKLAKRNPGAYEPHMAMTLNNLGALYADIQKHAQAETAYKEALSIRKKLAARNPDAYEPYVAATLNNIAGLYVFSLNRPDEAWRLVEEGLGIRRRLWNRFPPAFGDDLAKSLEVSIETGIRLGKDKTDLCARAKEIEQVAYRADLKAIARGYIQRFCGGI
ncbi:MAG: tetratricopeptide repeat protein, partial [Nitrospinae bacterium]|nr:tetratricopeptide repeat protein [Nitrospinota bacterium]